MLYPLWFFCGDSQVCVLLSGNTLMLTLIGIGNGGHEIRPYQAMLGTASEVIGMWRYTDENHRTTASPEGQDCQNSLA